MLERQQQHVFAQRRILEADAAGIAGMHVDVQAARATLGPEARLASAFHKVGAKLLEDDAPVDCDVLVFSDDDAARAEAAALVQAVGLRAIEAGPLANSAAAEALTSVLIQINRRYKASHAGIRITGLKGES